jgi:hypothetical protein
LFRRPALRAGMGDPKVGAMKDKGESAMEIFEGLALDGLSITLIGLGILALLVLFAGAKTVPQGYKYTVERFGY